MNIDQTLAMLDADIVAKLKTAIEIGKWPTGVALTAEQRQTCMQAVAVWEYKNLPEHERTGYIDKGTKKEDDHCDSHVPANDDPLNDGFQPIRFT